MQPKVPVGLSTLSLGGISLVAYVLAVIAFIDGQRDDATISAVVVGTVALVTMAAGRFWQAVEKIKSDHWQTIETIRAERVSGQPVLNELAAKAQAHRKHDEDRSSWGVAEPQESLELTPDDSLADPELDEPDYAPPSSEQHSRLN